MQRHGNLLEFQTQNKGSIIGIWYLAEGEISARLLNQYGVLAWPPPPWARSKESERGGESMFL